MSLPLSLPLWLNIVYCSVCDLLFTFTLLAVLFLTQFLFYLSFFILPHVCIFFLFFCVSKVLLSPQVLTTLTCHYTLTWHPLQRPWPPQSRVLRSGTACGLKSPSPTLSLVSQQQWKQGRKQISFMNALCLTWLYRASIMFSKLKPCDMWEGKKPY